MAKRVGRPDVIIDWGKLDSLLALGATLMDCSDILGCSEDTIEKNLRVKFKLKFSEYREKKLSTTRVKLRQKQIDVALKGNVTMLIWLGKQMLNQSDKIMQLDESTLEFE